MVTYEVTTTVESSLVGACESYLRHRQTRVTCIRPAPDLRSRP